MIKKISLVCVIIFCLTGCKFTKEMFRMAYMGSSYNNDIDYQITTMKLSCQSNGFENCQIYYQCALNQYKQMRTSQRIRWVIISERSFFSDSVEETDYSNLMSKLYERVEFLDKVSSTDFIDRKVGIGYLIKTHNHCASLIGDKTYNIDKYMPLIKEKLKIED